MNPFPCTYQDGYGGLIDWSGQTCVVVCLECGWQGGTTFTIEDGKDLLAEHRDTHRNAKGKLNYSTLPYRFPKCVRCTRKPATRRGYCKNCAYAADQAWAEGRTPDPLPEDQRGQACTEEGCTGEIKNKAMGLCSRHYYRWRVNRT